MQKQSFVYKIYFIIQKYINKIIFDLNAKRFGVYTILMKKMFK